MRATDVIVVGVGTCGEDASLRLLRAGLEVVGIEPRLVGGECPYYACLPTKSLIRSARLLQEARRADGLVGRVDVTADWSVVARRLREEITGGWVDSAGVARFEGLGGHFVRGRGALSGPRSVVVEGQEFEARVGIILATGSSPLIPPIPGMDTVGYWSTRDAIQVETLPESLLVLGGGAVGCELGQVFARFGVRVTIVEGAARLLPSEEPVASAVVAEALEADGIRIEAGVRVASLARVDGRVRATLETGSELEGDALLVATGRAPNLAGLGLEVAGIASNGASVPTDARLRAADGIWAIGDITGVGMYTHVALYQGSIAVADILGRDPAPADYSALPRATFTDPELGAIGLTEAQARDAGFDVSVSVKQVGSTFRGWLHRTGNAGVIKLVVDRASGRLLGATTAGPHGAEVLGMLTLAMRAGVPVSSLVDMMYAFPTFHGGIGETLGAYGRGIGRVLDPATAPMFDD